MQWSSGAVDPIGSALILVGWIQIRIRIQEGKRDPKKEKREEISCFEVLYILVLNVHPPRPHRGKRDKHSSGKGRSRGGRVGGGEAEGAAKLPLRLHYEPPSLQGEPFMAPLRPSTAPRFSI